MKNKIEKVKIYHTDSVLRAKKKLVEQTIYIKNGKEIKSTFKEVNQ